MSVEAEIKAKLTDPATVRHRLDELAIGEVAQYRDTYFDISGDRELRIRTIVAGGQHRHLLTFKEPPVDTATGSRPEHETAVTDPEMAAQILAGLGHPEVLSFVKDCVNYRINRGDRQFLATLVTVPEIADTFLEVETVAADGDLPAALAAVRALLSEIGVADAEFTMDTYTDAVRTARAPHTR